MLETSFEGLTADPIEYLWKMLQGLGEISSWEAGASGMCVAPAEIRVLGEDTVMFEYGCGRAIVAAPNPNKIVRQVQMFWAKNYGLDAKVVN